MIFIRVEEGFLTAGLFLTLAVFLGVRSFGVGNINTVVDFLWVVSTFLSVFVSMYFIYSSSIRIVERKSLRARAIAGKEEADQENEGGSVEDVVRKLKEKEREKVLEKLKENI